MRAVLESVQASWEWFLAARRFSCGPGEFFSAAGVPWSRVLFAVAAVLQLACFHWML